MFKHAPDVHNTEVWGWGWGAACGLICGDCLKLSALFYKKGDRSYDSQT